MIRCSSCAARNVLRSTASGKEFQSTPNRVCPTQTDYGNRLTLDVTSCD